MRLRANTLNLVYRHKRRLRRLRPPLIWLKHRGLTDRDVLLASYPKSGNTWLRFMLAELFAGQPAAFGGIRHVVPYVGRHRRARAILPGGGRLVKTHEPYRREYHRAIFLVRDVRDVVVSYYNRPKQRRAGGRATLKEFLPAFLRGTLNAYGSWSSHTASWLDAAGRAKIHVVRYEDLRRAPEEMLAGTCDFLGAKIGTDLLRAAVEHNTFEKMREKENQFRETLRDQGRREARLMRRGALGEWSSALDAEDLQLISRYAGPTLARLGYPPIAATAGPVPAR